MHSFVKLLVTVGIGIVLGFLAVALALCTEGLKSWKNSIARGIIHDGAPRGILRAAIFHCGYSTGLILIGSCMVSLCVRLVLQGQCSRESTHVQAQLCRFHTPKCHCELVL